MPPPSSPFFSVLIAAYNQERFIEATLSGVARQLFTDFELVVVDDGSTDQTRSICERWIEAFSLPNRIVLESIPNAGQSAALEHGIAFCRGRYVSFLDGDDTWLPDKLQRVAEAANASPEAGMIVHPLWVIDETGRRTGDIRPKKARLSNGDIRAAVRRTARQVAPATTGVTIRSDVLAQLLPMPTRQFRSAADFYLTLGASLLAPVKAIDTPLGEYRMQRASFYVRRTTTAEGLESTVRLQSTVAAHFGLNDAARRNPYFLRHEFALHKFRGALRRAASSWLSLLRATFNDPSYRSIDKLLFAGFWTVCLLAPGDVFKRLWEGFQLRHTGQDRIGQ